MTERDRVLDAFRNCITEPKCRNCPWTMCSTLDNGSVEIPRDLALAVMRELVSQEPRVMTWVEAQANVQDGPFIIFEVRDSTGSEVDFGVLVGDYYEMSEGSVLTVADFWMMKDDYGKRFRLWTSCPTDEQREATPWN